MPGADDNDSTSISGLVVMTKDSCCVDTVLQIKEAWLIVDLHQGDKRGPPTPVQLLGTSTLRKGNGQNWTMVYYCLVNFHGSIVAQEAKSINDKAPIWGSSLILIFASERFEAPPGPFSTTPTPYN
jgi:hypothetical protein